MNDNGRLQIVRDCYRAYESGQRGALDEHLSEELTFYSPADVGIDRERYFERSWANAELIGTFEIVRLLRLGSAPRALGYHPLVAGTDLLDEIANELDTWPGVRIEPRPDGSVAVRYENIEMGVLDPAEGAVELRFSAPEHDELVERGDALPSSDVVSHDVRGPSDVSAALELFDRRYRDLRGEDDPYTSADPA